MSIIERQVFDLPPHLFEVTAHRAEVNIGTCGPKTQADFPAHVTAPVQYGPRVKALSVSLSNQQLIPEDRLQQLFVDLFQLPIATATLATFSTDFAARVAPAQAQVLAELKAAPVKHMDETGFRVGGKTQWLHVISSSKGTHYRVSAQRGALLEGVSGIVVHDHWKSLRCRGWRMRFAMPIICAS